MAAIPPHCAISRSAYEPAATGSQPQPRPWRPPFPASARSPHSIISSPIRISRDEFAALGPLRTKDTTDQGNAKTEGPSSIEARVAKRSQLQRTLSHVLKIPVRSPPTAPASCVRDALFSFRTGRPSVERRRNGLFSEHFPR
jgi:hypothetical protein